MTSMTAAAVMAAVTTPRKSSCSSSVSIDASREDRRMVRIEATLKPRQMEKPLRLPLPKERASVSGRRRLYRHQEPKGLANGEPALEAPLKERHSSRLAPARRGASVASALWTRIGLRLHCLSSSSNRSRSRSRKNHTACTSCRVSFRPRGAWDSSSRHRGIGLSLPVLPRRLLLRLPLLLHLLPNLTTPRRLPTTRPSIL